ncbi:hypothetical protein OAF37_03750 [Rubripirellula sp.]|nr:hypothetical protein [Rubripirellula sp.]MDB4393766.1 hypothetical protein [Rhodopirellula sp.]MDB4645152.1 hypothetical protein [Rubripirellula sp.]
MSALNQAACPKWKKIVTAPSKLSADCQCHAGDMVGEGQADGKREAGK